MASTEAILAKIADIITNDVRLTLKKIANLVGISSGTVITILMKHLGLQKLMQTGYLI